MLAPDIARNTMIGFPSFSGNLDIEYQAIMQRIKEFRDRSDGLDIRQWAAGLLRQRQQAMLEVLRDLDP
jgi:hypothetical protein